jgi:hypothetical protein
VAQNKALEGCWGVLFISNMDGVGARGKEKQRHVTKSRCCLPNSLHQTSDCCSEFHTDSECELRSLPHGARNYSCVCLAPRVRTTKSTRHCSIALPVSIGPSGAPGEVPHTYI